MNDPLDPASWAEAAWASTITPAKDEGEMAGDEVFRTAAGILIPTMDVSPSKAVAMARWDNDEQTVTFMMQRGGEPLTFDCNLSTWITYKLASSKGEALNQIFLKRY